MLFWHCEEEILLSASVQFVLLKLVWTAHPFMFRVKVVTFLIALSMGVEIQGRFFLFGRTAFRIHLSIISKNLLHHRLQQ